MINRMKIFKYDDWRRKVAAEVRMIEKKNQEKKLIIKNLVGKEKCSYFSGYQNNY